MASEASGERESPAGAFEAGSPTCIARQSQHAHQEDRTSGKALVDANTERAVIDAALRVETIHGVKGESLDAVLYLADKEHVKALVNGTGTELGRIGYVALTRARNLFWLGILKADADTYRSALTGHTFVERQYDAQLDLPLASNL